MILPSELVSTWSTKFPSWSKISNSAPDNGASVLASVLLISIFPLNTKTVVVLLLISLLPIRCNTAWLLILSPGRNCDSSTFVRKWTTALSPVSKSWFKVHFTLCPTILGSTLTAVELLSVETWLKPFGKISSIIDPAGIKKLWLFVSLIV